MAKSMRSKREKRLRAIRREIVQPFYDEKEAAKLSAQEAALAAPKLQVPVRSSNTMEISTSTVDNTNRMDVDMADDNKSKISLKPAGKIGKKLKKKFKMAKGNRRNGNGKPSRKRHI
ncbi:unnamed protein product [Vicia faba]|uniref:Uncharacterized protein n=1 Tax=Vicia faba TaxID=3906 RepID=A0AAV1B4W2_VICFA|nr:unnamed protein product [Vicia faba]